MFPWHCSSVLGVLAAQLFPKSQVCNVRGDHGYHGDFPSQGVRKDMISPSFTSPLLLGLPQIGGRWLRVSSSSMANMLEQLMTRWARAPRAGTSSWLVGTTHERTRGGTSQRGHGYGM